MTDRDKIIETMADEKRSRCAECGAWGPVREYHPFAYCQLVKAIGEKAARANIDAVVEYGRELERSHLQASGMAVVQGWRRMPTENIDVKAAPFDRRPFLGTLSNGWVVVLSAPELPWRYAWWRCDNLSVPVDHTHAPDSLNESLRLVAWMPLIAPADFGKAPMQEGSAEAQSAVAHPFNPVVQEKKDE